MKKLLTLLALGSTTLLLADQSYRYPSSDYASPSCSYPGCNGERNEQSPSHDGGYYNPNQRYSQGNPMNDQRQRYSDSNDYNQNPRYSQGNRNDWQSSSNHSYNQNRFSSNEPNSNASMNDERQKNTQQIVASDHEVTKKIREALSSGWFSKGFTGVTFDVYDGNITLRGSVDTVENKNKVEEKVKSIDGVKNINNQIIVDANANTSSNTSSQNNEKIDLQESNSEK